MKKTLKIISLFLVITACNNSDNYIYFDNFKRYLVENQKVKSFKSPAEYMLFESNCYPCIKPYLDILDYNKRSNLTLIMSDDKSDEKTNIMIEKLKIKYKVCYDINSISSKYELGLLKVKFVAIKEGKCIFSSDKYNEIKEYFDKN